ncbi:unnamed protein product [Lasius platythorax]|uniref:Peptidase S1 domain-containing protein n=1 Tax=Lasius platythorax TaxID=488582 RepID=A0AAV2P7U8_9HYME
MKQLACVLIALAITGIYADEPEKLVNGIPTSIEKYPHAVSIRTNNNHMCGGSIISARHILTAAHCVEPLLKDAKLRRDLTVVSGTTLLSSGGERHKVSRMWYHEKFDLKSGDGSHDIGLLELAAPISFNSKQQPIKLPTSDLTKGESVTIVAWGSRGFLRPVHDDLQKLDAKCMPADECQKYHKLMPVSENEFCTLITKGTGACNGDSGSGVVRNSDGTIVGAVSRGIPCARGLPDVFTSVSKFVSWINEKMLL